MASISKCPLCGNKFIDIDNFTRHLRESHEDDIPEDMKDDPYQFIYMLKTGKANGSCVMCKKPTKWNPSTHKYHRFCDNPECKKKYSETFKNRMIGKYGKVTLLNDPEHQKKMLANRSISGTYTWRDKVHQHTYTGTYEKSFLEFLDCILNFDPEDVIAPSPHTYWYIYDGKKHFYIPDFFIPSLNLEIEIKDGTNTHPKIQAVDKEKERLKDQVMIDNKNSINYIKIVEKDNTRFLEYLEKAKEAFFLHDQTTGIIII